MPGWELGLQFGFHLFVDAGRWWIAWGLSIVTFFIMSLPNREIGKSLLMILVLLGIGAPWYGYTFFYVALIVMIAPGFLMAMALRGYAAYQRADQAAAEEEKRKAEEAEALAEDERIKEEAQRRAETSRQTKALSHLDDHFLTMRTALRAIDPAADGSMMVSTIDETLHMIRKDPTLRDVVLGSDDYAQQLALIRAGLAEKNVTDRFIYRSIDRLVSPAALSD